MKTIISALIGVFFTLHSVVIQAQELSGLSRVETQQSSISDRLFGGIDIEIALNQAIPFRVFTLSEPNRVIVDFRIAEWNTADARSVNASEKIKDIRFGIFKPGWSRLVLPLLEPQIVKSAEMQVGKDGGGSVLHIVLDKSDQETFAARSGMPTEDDPTTQQTAEDQKPRVRQTGGGPLTIAIDPGHGGVDPGAIAQGYNEKELVLGFARELKEALIRSGRYNVELTRNGDEFVSLTGRIAFARHVDADVLLSLHADALADGSASGITVYTLSERASTQAAAQLAAQLDKADLLAGVDLTGSDQTLTSVLMDMARLETNARSDALAEHLVEGIASAVKRSRKRPRLSAAFTVLKAPDIPSVLIELGFLTTRKDLRNLLNEKWRALVIKGIVNSLDTWALEDAAQAGLLRK